MVDSGRALKNFDPPEWIKSIPNASNAVLWNANNEIWLMRWW